MHIFYYKNKFLMNFKKSYFYVYAQYKYLASKNKQSVYSTLLYLCI